MQTFKTQFRTLTAAVAIGALSVGFAPTANATATYDATASFDLTLASVTDAAGADVTSGWSVDAEGSIFDQDILVLGIGMANVNTVIAPMTSLGIGTTVSQSSQSLGSSTHGVASSYALTDLDIDISNSSGGDLIFRFDYVAMVDAMVTGMGLPAEDANTSAEVYVPDFMLDIFAVADLIFLPLSASDSEMSSFSLTLGDGEQLSFTGEIDTGGFAVPEPTSVALLTVGLIGVGVKRRWKIA